MCSDFDRTHFPFLFCTSIWVALSNIIGLHNTFLYILGLKITAGLCNSLAGIQALYFVIIQKATVLGIKRSLAVFKHEIKLCIIFYIQHVKKKDS